MKSPNEIRPRRGWVYMADLDPPRGTEPGKVRPVLALQTDLLSRHSSTVVLPLTTNVVPQSRLLRVHIKKGEAGLSADSDVMIDQPRAIDNRRLKRALGAAPGRCLEEIERNVAILLDLPGA
ncbi:MAG: type II toxin-antitoxin system PemK/MazF family toxin [Elusimicrobiota bacterium]